VAGVEGSADVTDALRNRPYHHGNLAAAALAAAEAEIALHGIAEASLRKVADRAGVSHTAVGKRFGDKAGLLAALAAEGYRVLGERLGAAAGDMRAMGRAYVEFAVRRPALFSVMFQPTVYRADDPGVVAARAATTALLRQGVGQATDSPTSAAAFGAWAFVHGIAALVLGGAIEGDAIELYERAAMALFPGGPPAV
jgi:AcrR family transcriptional regulator